MYTHAHGTHVSHEGRERQRQRDKEEREKKGKRKSHLLPHTGALPDHLPLLLQTLQKLPKTNRYCLLQVYMTKQPGL